MTEISLDKKYRTKGGYEVNLFSFHDGQTYCFIGEYKSQINRWVASAWTGDGKNITTFRDYDLVEVKEPQYVYLNVYKEEDEFLLFSERISNSREMADKNCVPVLINNEFVKRVGCIKTLLEERFDD